MTSDNMTDSALRSLPVSISNILGDPFLPEQAEDTYAKLDSLRESAHDGPISILTKARFDPSMLKRLATYSGMSRLIVFYTMTGFSEGGIPFRDRLANYRQLSGAVPRLVLLFRPVVPNSNDSDEIINTLVSLCAETKTHLVYTGIYVDDGSAKRKFLPPETEKRILEHCQEQKVHAFPKTACAAAHILGSPCYAHVREAPVNLALAKRFYDLEEDNQGLMLAKGTPGDLNFIRHLTHTKVTIRSVNRYHFLSLRTAVPLLCSSSWFSWSRVIPCAMHCWYCCADYVFPECRTHNEIGCNPLYIPRVFGDDSQWRQIVEAYDV
jgi:hypothetical protein